MAGIMVVVLFFGVIWFGVYSSGYTTLLLRRDEPVDGYLPVGEYALVDESTGQPVTTVRRWHYPSQYTTLTSAGDGKLTTCRIDKKDCKLSLVTSRGIRAGSSWNDFVNRYDGMTAMEILVTDTDGDDDYKSYMSDDDLAAEQESREHRYMTVGDFDNDYVRTGRVDLATQRVTVTFRAGYQSGKVLYTARDQSDGYSKSVDRHRWWIPWNHRSGQLDGPALQYWTMEFEFGNNVERPYIDDGDVISISVRMS
ncbi:hypothetical protein CS006_02380 [Bifidobacterium primatium]|uniref:Uncharacterized protein n=1 Tax=Bifidobacterium primatium TaxID=2045438 RepID=A0A2M9HB22_9BIFI|nr:hypothetical protein [Bifidobacterium primatium]PJM74016.1 hypothetical protein CS006_02380 [Bifidobacterium primatium]